MLYFIGDIHAELEQLARKLTEKNIRDSHLVQVGDFGFGFFGDREKAVIESLNAALKAGNNLLYVIRGNHDNPSYFAEEREIGNIRIIPDYSVLELGGYSILLVGGAISVDRTSRVLGTNYWKEEKFVLDLSKLESALRYVKTINIVVTHTAPSEFWPFELNNSVRSYARRDKNLLLDLSHERAQHSKLLKYVTSSFSPSHWYYGHFHASEMNRYESLTYFALGELEIRQHI